MGADFGILEVLVSLISTFVLVGITFGTMRQKQVNLEERIKENKEEYEKDLERMRETLQREKERDLEYLNERYMSRIENLEEDTKNTDGRLTKHTDNGIVVVQRISRVEESQDTLMVNTGAMADRMQTIQRDIHEINLAVQSKRGDKS